MILVTGMQRSGTSLVSQLLATLGLSFGDPAELLPGDRWNAAGYYEMKAVMDVNSRIITGLPRNVSRFGAWLSKVAYLRMPELAPMAVRAERQRGVIEAIGRRHRSTVLKDPRFCLTLRFWLQWTAVAKVVVCIRHPAAVLASLARRHWLPRGLTARFYAYHVDALLDQLPAHEVLFVDVDRLVAGEAGELDALRQGLGLHAGPPSSALLSDVVRSEAFVPTELCRQPCPPVAQAAWQRLVERAAVARPVISMSLPR